MGTINQAQGRYGNPTPPPQPRIKRPLGVTLVASFYLLGAALFLAVLLVGLLQPAFVSNLHSRGLIGDIENARTHPGVHEIVAVIFAALGAGLWSLKSFARYTVLVITGLHLVLQAATLAHAAGSRRADTPFFWFATTVSAAIFIYLTRPHVRRAFARSQV